MNIYLAFFLWTAFGFLCMHAARKKNRNPYLWFIGGFFFTIFALAVILFLPHKPKHLELQAKPSEELRTQEIESTNAQVEKVENLGSKRESLEDQKFWYYLDSQNNQHGPMTFQGLVIEWYDGKIKPNSYVWNEDLEDWKPLNELSEFKNLQNPQN